MNELDLRDVWESLGSEEEMYKKLARTKPYVRIAVSEGQWPVLLQAIKAMEFALREELRQAKGGDDATAVESVRARIRAMGKLRIMLIESLRERGWLA